MTGLVLWLVANRFMTPDTGAEWLLAMRQVGALDIAIAATVGLVLAYVGLT